MGMYFIVDNFLFIVAYVARVSCYTTHKLPLTPEKDRVLQVLIVSRSIPSRILNETKSSI